MSSDTANRKSKGHTLIGKKLGQINKKSQGKNYSSQIKK